MRLKEGFFDKFKMFQVDIVLPNDFWEHQLGRTAFHTLHSRSAALHGELVDAGNTQNP